MVKLMGPNGMVQMSIEEARTRAMYAEQYGVKVDVFKDAIKAAEVEHAQAVKDSKPPEKARADFAQIDTAYNNLGKLMDKYDTLISRTGAILLPGVNAEAANELRRAIQLEIKNLYSLGAIQTPDVPYIEGLVPPDANAASPRNWTGGLGERVTDSVERLKDILRDKRNAAALAVGEPEVGPAPPSGPSAARAKAKAGEAAAEQRQKVQAKIPDAELPRIQGEKDPKYGSLEKGDHYIDPFGRRKRKK